MALLPPTRLASIQDEPALAVDNETVLAHPERGLGRHRYAEPSRSTGQATPSQSLKMMYAGCGFAPREAPAPSAVAAEFRFLNKPGPI